MIKAELRSENTFCFTINASIFNERVLTKALYWYTESFIIYWNENKDNLFEITLELKPSANKIYTFPFNYASLDMFDDSELTELEGDI